MTLPSWFIIQITAVASLGGCLFGYDMGAISGALPQLTIDMNLTSQQQEWAVSILYLGGGLGAAVGGTICDTLGRQRTIVWTDVVFFVGAFWLYMADSFSSVLWGRFVVGIAVAVSGVADVSYLHEVAPLEWRGAIVSVNEACISLGFLLAYLAGYVYPSNWRMIFGLAGIMAMIQGMGMWFLPESPVWLAEQGRVEESRKAWKKINGRQPTESDLPALLSPTHNPDNFPYQISHSPNRLSQSPNRGEETHSFESLDRLMVGNSDDQLRSLVWIRSQVRSLVATIKRYRRQVIIALFLAITQQFCGQTNVLNYATHILADNAEDWFTLAIGIVKFVVTVIVIWKIEQVGRRTLLLAGMSLIALGMLVLVVAFGGSASALALPGVLLVVFGYSMSFGPLTWLLTAEIFPTEIRGRALGASTIITYLCASLVTNTFLSASAAIGHARVFAMYSIITTIGIIFAFLAIPDTGEKSVDQIEDSMKSMWWWRKESLSQSEHLLLARRRSRDDDKFEMSSNPIH